MSSQRFEYTTIDTLAALQELCASLKQQEWIGLDTEFIGERRYTTLLCLLQVSAPTGIFLIDGIALKGQLHAFIELLTLPDLLKITHAGENDYRIFYELYGVVPTHIFDTQIAAGFLSGKYPMSFKRIISQFLELNIPKGYSNTDWEKRPLTQKQIEYAIQDVIYLKDVYDVQKSMLQKEQKWEWALEEMQQYELKTQYLEGPQYAFLKDKLAQRLDRQSQAFLLRLYRWRDNQARKMDQNAKRILSNRHMHLLAQHIQRGKGALLSHRQLPDKIIHKHWDVFTDLHNQAITDEERDIIASLPQPLHRSVQSELAMDLLFWIIKYRCTETNIAHGLVLRGTSLNKLKTQVLPESHPDTLNKMTDGWRRELIGDSLNAWLDQDVSLRVKPQGQGYFIEMLH